LAATTPDGNLYRLHPKAAAVSTAAGTGCPRSKARAYAIWPTATSVRTMAGHFVACHGGL